MNRELLSIPQEGKQFESIDQLINWINDLTVQEVKNSHLRWTLTEDRRILPSEWPEFLFRGQYKYYEKSFPSLYRIKNIVSDNFAEDEIDKIVDFVKACIQGAMFEDQMQHHPGYKWAQKNHINIDIEIPAIDQHYEIKTHLFDFTSSLKVASFFACCEKKNLKWSPVSEGIGIIYIFDTSYFKQLFGQNTSNYLFPIGHQPLPRPAEQWAWCYNGPQGTDINQAKYVRKLFFKHNEKSSEMILNEFNSGNKLFPNDPLADLADKVLNADSFPETIANNVITQFCNIKPKYSRMADDITRVIKNKYKLVTKHERLFTDEMVEEAEPYLAFWARDFYEETGAKLII